MFAEIFVLIAVEREGIQAGSKSPVIGEGGIVAIIHTNVYLVIKLSETLYLLNSTELNQIQQ